MATRFAAFENKMNSLATQAKTSNTENVIKSIPMSQIDENTLNDKTFSMNNIETLAALQPLKQNA